MRAHGPWAIEDSTERFTNAFLQLREDRVTQPDGSSGTYATVALKPGVAVLPVEERGTVLLTQQFRYAIGRDSVEVVCGATEQGEDPLEAARRELREEVGLLAQQWSDLGTLDLDTSIVRCPVRLFLAEDLRRTDVDPDATEDIRRVTVPFDTAVRMVLEGGVTHAPSCVLILKAAWHRERR